MAPQIDPAATGKIKVTRVEVPSGQIAGLNSDEQKLLADFAKTANMLVERSQKFGQSLVSSLPTNLGNAVATNLNNIGGPAAGGGVDQAQRSV
jgi:hypothetical protein